MKKLIILCLISLIVITMVACGKAEEENELIGTWIDEDGDTLTLKKDGEYESTHYYDKKGTWESEEDTLIFKSDFDKEKTINYKIEDENGHLIFEEKDLIFGGNKETKFVKKKDN